MSAKPAIPPTEEPKDLSSAIEAISDGLKKLIGSGLNRRALVVLLQDATGVSKRDITAVLDGLNDLKKLYTCPK